MIALWGLLTLVGLVLAGVAVFLVWPLRHPLPTESDYTHRTVPWWYLYYGKKWLRSIPGAERGSGLEERFASMDFAFERDPLAESRRVVIKACGDLMVRQDLVGEGSRLLWDEVGPYLFDADLCIGNMEFAVNPDWFILETVRFSVTPQHAEPLLGDPRFGRFDLVTLGNNHINDSLSGGIVSTCDWLDSIGMRHVGGNRTAEEQDDFPILDVGGVRIAVLSYTFSTNDIPLEPGFEHGTNLVRFNALRDEDYDPSLILRQVALARERGADLVIACNHWSIEFEYYPAERLVRRAEALCEAGVDVIIGHHPHHLQCTGHYRASDGRDCVIFYSLGNLTASALPRPLQRLSQIAELEIELGLDAEGRRVVRPARVALAPVLYARRKLGGRVEQRLVMVKRAVEALEAGQSLDHLRRWERFHLRRLLAEHRRVFLPRGVQQK